MDDTKKSLVTSSMVDLKAELFRKQEEFKRQKAAGSSFVKGAKTEKNTKGSIWSRQNAGVLARSNKDQESKEGDDHDEDAHAKSMRALEEKSRLYDKLCNSSTIPEEDGSEYYLVDFQKKVIDTIVEDREAKQRKKDEEEVEAENCALAADIPEPTDPDEEWIDFKDSLGRDRRCMKKDLDQLLKQDRKLALAQIKNKRKDATDEGSSQLPSLMSSDMHREIMRQKWEDEMKELQEKGQQDIHYANVRFDEIRSHGVGFFQFSKDHEKREEQLEDFRKMRKETLDEHSRKDLVEEKRKAMMEARLAKVRQRRNLKEPPAEVKSESDNASDAVGPKLSEATLTPDAEDVIKKEEMDRLAEEKRKTHVREWDKDKQRDIPPSKKNYIETLRDEREQEFAPPCAYFEGPRIKPFQASDSCRIKLPEKLNSTISTTFVPPPINTDNQQFSSSKFITEDKATGSSNADEYNKIANSSEFQKSGTPLEFQGGVSASTNQYQTNGTMDNNWTGPYAGYGDFHHYYGHNLQAAQYGQDMLQFGSHGSQQHGGIQDYQQFDHQQQVPTQYTPSPIQHQQPAYFYGADNQQLHGEAKMNRDWSKTASAAVLDDATATAVTKTPLHFTSTSNSMKNKHDSVVDQPSRPKIPKMAIIDTRFVKNEVSSAENTLSINHTLLTAVPYAPGSFTAAKQFTVKQHEESVADSRLKNQISGSPLLYTAEQLKKQMALQVDYDNEEIRHDVTDAVADKKSTGFSVQY